VRDATRRRFLRGGLGLVGAGLLAGCTAPPRAVDLPTRTVRLGYLRWGSDDRVSTQRLAALRDGLGELGYVEGRNLLLELRVTPDAERLPELATELVRLPVDLIVAQPTRASLVAKAATTSIPVIFPYAGDPVETGLVASLARPGGNVTGLTQLAPELAPKRLELLREVLPTLIRVAILWTAPNPAKVLEQGQLQAAAGTLGLKIQSLPVREAADIGAALEAALIGQAQALVPLVDPVVSARRAEIVEFVTRHRLLSISETRDFVDDGGLLSYGADIVSLYRRAATYIDRILKGDTPADLPVERPTTFELLINLRAAQTIGVTIPPAVLQQATEVIQ
jgi:ABC-type uncharacterized transport system substrate-binding protein